MNAWFGSSLVEPWLLLVATLLPFAWWIRRIGGCPALRVASVTAATTTERRPSVRMRLRRLPSILEAMAVVALCVALARPVERVAGARTTLGVDILLCLDASSSMAEPDGSGSATRFDVARRALAAFLAKRPADRIGLVAFAAHADLVAPPTLDHDGLATLLDELSTVEPDGPEDLTGIGNAIAHAAEVSSASTVETRIVILFTDGEENLATPDRPDEIGPLEAVALCREFGVRLYAITTATRDSLGNAAMLTGGRAFRIDDASALAGALAEIDALERSPIVTTTERIEERFWGWTLLGIAFGVVALLLRAGPLGVAP